MAHGNWTAFDRRMTRLAHKHMKDKCERCGTAERLMVHHKDKDRSNNKPENLMTLCFSCHDVVEWENGRVKASHRTVCRVCGQPERAKGLCNMHYTRLRLHGDYDSHKRERATCSVCGGKAIGRGLCGLHYQRVTRLGSTELPFKSTQCSICGKKIKAKGVCKAHYGLIRNQTLPWGCA